jgi:hypothetical protein
VSFLRQRPAAARRDRAYSLRMGSDEVTLRITEVEGQEERTRELTAPDLATLLEQEPGLLDEVPGLRNVSGQPLGKDGLLRATCAPAAARPSSSCLVSKSTP